MKQNSIMKSASRTPAATRFFESLLGLTRYFLMASSCIWISPWLEPCSPLITPSVLNEGSFEKHLRYCAGTKGMSSPHHS